MWTVQLFGARMVLGMLRTSPLGNGSGPTSYQVFKLGIFESSHQPKIKYKRSVALGTPMAWAHTEYRLRAGKWQKPGTPETVHFCKRTFWTAVAMSSPPWRQEGVVMPYSYSSTTPPSPTPSTLGLQGETQCLQWTLESPTLNPTPCTSQGHLYKGKSVYKQPSSLRRPIQALHLPSLI